MPSLFSTTRIEIYTKVCKIHESEAKWAGSSPECSELCADCAQVVVARQQKCHQHTAPKLVNGLVVLCSSQ